MDSLTVVEVTLGGKPWPVGQLTARTNRMVDPLILRLLPVFAEWERDKMGALSALDEAQYAALQDIAFHAVKQANAGLTRDEFLQMPVTLPELVTAFPLVAQQTGIFSR